MTAYVSIPNGDVDPESPITTSLMVALRDNPTAIMEKASGAPVLANGYIVAAMFSAGAVDQTAIGASAVGQGELKASSGEVSTTSTTNVTLTLPGGAYGFYPQVKSSNVAGIGTAQIASAFPNTSYATLITLKVTSSSYTVYAQQVYVTASPPYNLGDGDIPLFVFAMVEKTSGKIVSVYAAPEAPWHYNGPTNISPSYYAGGKAYRQVHSLLAERMVTDGISLPEARLLVPVEARAGDHLVSLEIDQAMKNADMGLVPHPFYNLDSNQHQAVLLDPVSPIMEQLLASIQDGESANQLLHDGRIIIGNQSLGRRCPPGVLDVACRWKNTRAI